MKKETYFKQLDGIRFLAIFLVLVDHWFAEKIFVPLGILGVTMFFVLSGFLITRILILAKVKDGETKRNHWFSIKQFMIRRSIRIFPIYFLSIFVLYILDVPPVRDTIIWCLTYSTNIYIALNETWLGTIDHLWSLAVEEQYYLLFPYLILFLPSKNHKAVLYLMILSSVLLRIYLYMNGNDWMVQYVLMPTCLDCFGLGGLLAYWHTNEKEGFFDKLINPKWIISSATFLILFMIVIRWIQVEYNSTHHFGNLVVERFVYSLFCFFLIAGAVSGYKGILKVILENKFVIYLGKISYGLYLYHNFVFNFYHTKSDSPVLKVLSKIQNYFTSITSSIFFEATYYFIITFILATASWYLIEKPANKLKKYFSY